MFADERKRFYLFICLLKINNRRTRRPFILLSEVHKNIQIGLLIVRKSTKERRKKNKKWPI